MINTNTFEEYEFIGKRLKENRDEMVRLISNISNLCGKKYGNRLLDISTKLDKLRSDLEDRMFKDCPNEANTGVFYGKHLEAKEPNPDDLKKYEKGRHHIEMALEDIHLAILYGHQDKSVRAHIIRDPEKKGNKIIYYGMDRQTMEDLKDVLEVGYDCETVEIQKPSVEDLKKHLMMDDWELLYGMFPKPDQNTTASVDATEPLEGIPKEEDKENPIDGLIKMLNGASTVSEGIANIVEDLEKKGVLDGINLEDYEEMEGLGTYKPAEEPGDTGMTPTEARTVLGVDKNTTQEAIENRYKALMLLLHPDNFRDSAKQEQANCERDRINSAYCILCPNGHIEESREKADILPDHASSEDRKPENEPVTTDTEDLEIIQEEINDLLKKFNWCRKEIDELKAERSQTNIEVKEPIRRYVRRKIATPMLPEDEWGVVGYERTNQNYPIIAGVVKGIMTTIRNWSEPFARKDLIPVLQPYYPQKKDKGIYYVTCAYVKYLIKKELVKEEKKGALTFEENSNWKVVIMDKWK